MIYTSTQVHKEIKTIRIFKITDTQLYFTLLTYVNNQKKKKRFSTIS